MLKELNYIVNGQTLTGESFKVASDTVNEIKVSFAFEGTDWSGLDSIKAVFSNNRVADSYEAVLVNGTCTIPHEVLAEKGTVSVNLYGSIITGTTLTTRITSYKSAVVDVLQKVNVSGSNSVVPTPATWQQELSAHTQNTTVHVTAQNKTDWNAKVGEAPSDSKQYARKNGAWSEVEAGSSEAVWGQITGTLSNQTDLNTALGNKADKSDTYTKAQTDSAISNHHDSTKADASTTYTKTEVDSAISGHHDSTKADVGVSYTKAEEDALLDDKADAEDIPTKTSELTNDSGFIDSSYHDNTKVDKVEGKGLSTNDFTDTLKDKLDGIEANADVTDADNVKSSGATMGVKVAGTELTKDSDGKVNIQKASSGNLGVVSVWSLGGTYTNNSGDVMIYNAQNSDIDAKTQQYRPITPSNLDYAIKKGLTSNSQIQSDADKKACCGTIGAVYDGQYELIEEIVLTEDTPRFERTQDTNGVLYNFKSVFIKYVPYSYVAGNKYYEFYDGSTVCKVMGGFSAKNGDAPSYGFCEINGGMAEARGSMPNYEINHGMVFGAMKPMSKIDRIILEIAAPAGSTIKIYAIRN